MSQSTETDNTLLRTLRVCFVGLSNSRASEVLRCCASAVSKSDGRLMEVGLSNGVNTSKIPGIPTKFSKELC